MLSGGDGPSKPDLPGFKQASESLNAIRPDCSGAAVARQGGAPGTGPRGT